MPAGQIPALITIMPCPVSKSVPASALVSGPACPVSAGKEAQLRALSAGDHSPRRARSGPRHGSPGACAHLLDLSSDSTRFSNPAQILLPPGAAPYPAAGRQIGFGTRQNSACNPGSAFRAKTVHFLSLLFLVHKMPHRLPGSRKGNKASGASGTSLAIISTPVSPLTTPPTQACSHSPLPSPYHV